ncbi:MAG: L,D-transpeptidase family protein [Pseudomonadota bacterium]
MDLVVSEEILTQGDRKFRCAIGRSGLTANKTEGDGATPIGCYPLRQLLFRSDRLEQPVTDLPVRSLIPSDGWCDDPKDTQRYNQLVTTPYALSHEKLWCNDHVYDVIVVVGYNDDPCKSGKGSAIFIHLAREGYPPTAGCIALIKDDLLEVLKSTQATSKLIIYPPRA